MNIGFAVCGSFCTFDKVFPVMEALASQHTLIPIFSQVSYTTDSRFGTHETHIQKTEDICSRKVLHTIEQVEPIGPKKLLDALVIAPCTGNTLAKLAHSIADGPVTMAAKSHLRNGRPVIIAISTNDALAGAALHSASSTRTVQGDIEPLWTTQERLRVWTPSPQSPPCQRKGCCQHYPNQEHLRVLAPTTSWAKDTKKQNKHSCIFL